MLQIRQMEAKNIEGANAILAARLIISAAPAYYRIIEEFIPEIESFLAHQLLSPGSDLESASLLFRDTLVVGISISFPTAEVVARQAKSLRQFARSLDAGSRSLLLKSVQTYSAKIAPISEGKGVYLSKFAVDPECRGQGLGAKLLRNLINSHENEIIALHVDRKNADAIALYEKSGFEERSAPDYEVAFYTRDA